MVIIYGRRSYGRVHAWQGEWLHTSFAHLWFMPLVPLHSTWAREQLDQSVVGFPVRLSLYSVAMAYARMWLPVAGVACLVAGGAGGAIAGLALLAGSAAAWLARGLRSPSAQRRSDFNLLAYGTRCDPAHMQGDFRAMHRAKLEERQRALPSPRPPDDVARFGPASLEEAAVAYGLLRLAVVERGRAASAEAEAIARLLATSHDAAAQDGGPYRDASTGDGDADRAAIGAIHAEAAAAAERVSAARRAGGVNRRRRVSPRAQVVVAIGALTAAGMFVYNVPALLPARQVSAADLDAKSPPYWRYATVDCAEPDQLGVITNAKTGNPERRVFGCAVDGRELLVMTDADTTELPAQPRGRLERVAAAGNPVELQSVPNVATLYLSTTKNTEDEVMALVGLAGTLAALGFGVRWLVRRRRAKIASRSPA